MPMHRFVWIMAALLLSPASALGQAKVPSTVALEVTTPLTVFYGEAIDGLAQVTANDGTAVTGTVTFYDGTKSFCSLTLANGASCPEGSEKGFEPGTHVITAVYSGDTTHEGATSNPVAVTVIQDKTTTALASSANPVAVGGGTIYTATVAGANAAVTGTVTFMDVGTVMGSSTLNASGTAALSVLMLVAGNHPVTAVYVGNGNSASSTSAVLHQLVQGTLTATSTALTASANPAVAKQNVTFTAKVVADGGKATPTGTVTFTEGGTALGSATVKAGAAVWSTSTLVAGSHSLVARYAGDGMTAASASAVLNEVVQAQTVEGSPGLTIGVGTITVAAGDTVSIPVAVNINWGMGKATTMSLSCSGLPEEASCSFVPGSSGAATGSATSVLRIATSAPRDCGSSTPYGVPAKSALLPVAGLLLALTGRRRKIKGLLALSFAVTMTYGMTGCGMGNCTDLGTRPGTYTITIIGSAGGAQVSQKVKLVVTP